MPSIRVSGELKVRQRLGIGPFGMKRWVTVDFDKTIGLDEKVEVAPRLKVEAVMTPGGYLIRGSLRGVRCDFGEIRDGATNVSLAAPSVGGTLLNGRAELVSD